MLTITNEVDRSGLPNNFLNLWDGQTHIARLVPAKSNNYSLHPQGERLRNKLHRLPIPVGKPAELLYRVSVLLGQRIGRT
jgi:hypothetical protein